VMDGVNEAVVVMDRVNEAVVVPRLNEASGNVGNNKIP